MNAEWKGFRPGKWTTSVNVRNFIQENYTMYDGDDAFLAGPTEATRKLWEQVMELSRQEKEAGGVLDMDTKLVSTITSHGPGYLNKDLETIVGFQTDKPFKRSLQPFGGIRMAEQACRDNGYEVDPEVIDIFTKYRKTHNQGVFDAYTPEMRLARKSAIITGDIIGYMVLPSIYIIKYMTNCGKAIRDTILPRLHAKIIAVKKSRIALDIRIV